MLPNPAKIPLMDCCCMKVGTASQVINHLSSDCKTAPGHKTHCLSHSLCSWAKPLLAQSHKGECTTFMLTIGAQTTLTSQLWPWGLLSRLRLDHKTSSLDSLNNWLCPVLANKLLSSPISIRNCLLLLVLGSWSMLGVLPSAIPSQCLPTAHQVRSSVSYGRKLLPLSGLPDSPMGMCITEILFLFCIVNVLMVFTCIPYMGCCPPYFSQYSKFILSLC